MATRRLLVEIVGDDASLQRSLKSSAATTEKFGASIAKSGLAMVKAFAPIVATFAAADFAKGAIEGAENLRKAQESLDAAIEHTGGNADKLTRQYTATAKAAAQFGITQTDATRGLAKATLLTGSAAAAQRAYQEAVVISKATGKDFNAVLTATSKGQVGITTSLRRYGILIDSTASGQEQFNQVMGRFAGQAEANTSASDKLHASFANLQTNLGTLLLPTFEKIVGWLNRFVLWLQSPQVSAAMHRFVAVVKIGFEDAWHVIQRVIAVIQDLWRTFGHTIVTQARNVWDAVKNTIKNALEIIRGIIDVIGGIIHGDWSRVWKGITEIVGGAVKQIWNMLRYAVRTLGNIAGLIGHAIYSGIMSGLNALKNAFVSLFNWIVGKLQWLLDKIHAVTSKIPGLGGGGGHSIPTPIPGVNIPLPFASGGIVTQPTFAMIGESGPEAVIPLSGRAGGFGSVVINMNGTYIGGKRQLEEEIVNGLSRWSRRNGNAQLRSILGAAGA